VVEAEIATIMKPNDVIRTLFSKERLDRNGLKQLVPAFDWDDFFVQFGYPNVGGRPRMHRHAHTHKCTHTRTNVPAHNRLFDLPTTECASIRWPLVCAPHAVQCSPLRLCCGACLRIPMAPRVVS
jgi:hypothetical protein